MDTNDSIMITGATGFLGRKIVSRLLKMGFNKESLVLCGNSENRLVDFYSKFNIPVYSFNVFKKTDFYKIDRKIDYIIHAAAAKHVGLCEKSPQKAIETNVVGSLNVIDFAIENNVKNVVGVSSDKALKPSCVYGATKLLMEKSFLERNFSIFRGVNFLYSSGSVLEIWDNQRKLGKALSVNETDCVRYFSTGDDSSKSIIENIDRKDCIFSVKFCYKISIHQLLKAYMKVHEYDNVEFYPGMDVEKEVEELPNKKIKVSNPNEEEIIKLLT